MLLLLYLALAMFQISQPGGRREGGGGGGGGEIGIQHREMKRSTVFANYTT